MPRLDLPLASGLTLSLLLTSAACAGGPDAEPAAPGPQTNLNVPAVRLGVSRASPGTEVPTTLLAWSPDGKRLASSAGGAVHLWEVPAVRAVRALPGHPGETLALRFGPAGTLFTAGADGLVREWGT